MNKCWIFYFKPIRKHFGDIIWFFLWFFPFSIRVGGKFHIYFFFSFYCFMLASRNIIFELQFCAIQPVLGQTFVLNSFKITKETSLKVKKISLTKWTKHETYRNVIRRTSFTWYYFVFIHCWYLPPWNSKRIKYQ